VTSELQRVARGLVECLDQTPQVAAELQRTARRCRDNSVRLAQLGRGSAYVSSVPQQFDAASRACDHAAEMVLRARSIGRDWAANLAAGVGAASSREGVTRTDAQSTPRVGDAGGRRRQLADAAIDRRKFVDYSMDPGNPRGRGKWKAWTMLGYDVHGDRDAAADDVIEQIQSQLPTANVLEGKTTAFGQRFESAHTIVGPNGRQGTARVVWQLDVGAERPRVLTNWLQVHKDDEVGE
jgi:hypothetical protein